MVQWNAEKDQIILKGIFKFHDIKSSAPLLEYLAEQIGGDCTAKAISHRLSNIRNTGKPLPSKGTPVKRAMAARKPTATPATPRRRAKSTPKKSATPVSSSESDDQDQDQDPDLDHLLSSPSVKRRASTKPSRSATKSYAESEGSDTSFAPHAPSSPLKRVKTEPVDSFPDDYEI